MVRYESRRKLGGFGGKIVFCITHKKIPPRATLKFLQGGTQSVVLLYGLTTIWAHEPFLFLCFYKYPHPITFHVKELLLFVSLDVNSQGSAFLEGDKSPSFGVGLFSLLLCTWKSHRVYELDTSFSCYSYTSLYGRATYGYTIRQSLMGLSYCIWWQPLFVRKAYL